VQQAGRAAAAAAAETSAVKHLIQVKTPEVVTLAAAVHAVEFAHRAGNPDTGISRQPTYTRPFWQLRALLAALMHSALLVSATLSPEPISNLSHMPPTRLCVLI
jgi:hypothetical protein